MGVAHPDALSPCHIFRRVTNENTKNFDEIYHYMQPGALLQDDIHPDYAKDGAEASAETF